MSSVHDYALAYISAGWPVLAVHTAKDGICTCGDTACKSAAKHPLLTYSPNGVTSATLNTEEAESWKGDFNLGIALGKRANGLMALDVDDVQVAQALLHPNIGLSDETSIVMTGRPGLHIYFQSTGATATHIVKASDGRRIGEVRGDGAYVVAPPSIAATGREYKHLGRKLDDFVRYLAITQDPKAFITNLLSYVGVEAEFAGEGSSFIEVPDLEVIEQGIPDVITTSSRLTELRQFLLMPRGGMPSFGEDRSRALSRFAHAIIDASKDFDYPIKPEQVAGILKHADAIYDRPKFRNRVDGDRYYLRTVLDALSTTTSALTESKSDVEKRKVDSEYIWDENDGWLYYQPQGVRSARRVCNFKPQVLEDIEIYYGEGEDSKRAYRVLFTHATGRTATFLIQAEDLEPRRLKEVIRNNCSFDYSIAARMIDHIEPAMIDLSESPTRSKAYATTGWVEHGDSHLFLLPGMAAAISRYGLEPTVRIDKRHLPDDDILSTDKVMQYGRGVRVPASTEDEVKALTAFKKLLSCGPIEVTFLVALQVLAGPLFKLGISDTPPTLHIMGKTGTLKTSFTKAALSIFGTFQRKDSPPLWWGFTETTIQHYLNRLKDLTVFVDDYKHSQENQRKAMRIVQSLADKSTRERSTTRQRVLHSQVPRGFLLSTGEDVWETEASAEARTTTVRVKDGDLSWLAILEVEKDIKQGNLQLFGGAYISWLARTDDIWSGWVQERQEDWHMKLLEVFSKKKVHLRIPAALAAIFTVSSVLQRFVSDLYGAEEAEKIGKMRSLVATDRLVAAIDQAEEVDILSPFQQLMRTLSDAAFAGEVCFFPGEGLSSERHRIPDVPTATVVGSYFTDESDKPKNVVLTRNMTFTWFKNRVRREGDDLSFAWRSVEQEASSYYSAQKVKNVWAYRGGHKSQLTGVRLPFTDLSDLIEIFKNSE